MSIYYDEIEYLQQLINGDEQAFHIIYKEYSPRLYGNLLKLVKSEIEAQEILQNVFIKIWDNRQNIDLDKSFKSYIFKIAENKVYDFFRKAARDKKNVAHLLAATNYDYLSVDDFQINKEKIAILHKAIESLSPQRQQVFRLCKLEGKSYREVSELLGISVSTISDHIVKATKTIRNYFEENDEALLTIFALTFLSTR